MLKKVTLYLLVFAAVVLVAGTWGVAFIRVNQSIPFDSLSIAPDGSPRLKPFVINMGDGLPGDTLKLAHMLAFDGGRYFSDFYLPITTTSLIQRDKDSYVWWDLEGKGFLLNMQPAQVNAKWSIRKIEGDKLLIGETDGVRRYIYGGGQLEEAQLRGMRQRFYYEGKDLKRIVISQPDGQTTLEFSYDKNGRLSVIDSSTERINFLRNDDGILTGIKGSNGLTMTFAYTDGLLTGANCDGKASTWKWGDARMMHSRPHVPLPPMLCSDGINNYEVFYGGNLTKVRWTQIETGITKKWDYLGLTDRMRVRAF